jgi:futalosine hydrolase
VILIACAVGKELEFFRPQPHVEMLVTGIGVVEASAAVSRALAQSTYDLVISAGIAGAFEGTAELGEGVVVADDLLQLDLETDAPLALPEGTRVIDRAGSDLVLVDRLVELGFRSVRGLTVTRVTATDPTASKLAKLGVGVESMEGFAVLRAAEIGGVPAIEVRGISNIVCERSRSRWDFAAGVRGLEKILTALLSLLGSRELG